MIHSYLFMKKIRGEYYRCHPPRASTGSGRLARQSGRKCERKRIKHSTRTVLP